MVVNFWGPGTSSSASFVEIKSAIGWSVHFVPLWRRTQGGVGDFVVFHAQGWLTGGRGRDWVTWQKRVVLCLFHFSIYIYQTSGSRALIGYSSSGYPVLVYTKPVNIHFQALWLATQALDTLCYYIPNQWIVFFVHSDWYVEITWTEHETQITQREHVKGLSEVKITRFYDKTNMVDTFLEKFTRCAKVCGLFFLDCALRVMIGWSDRMERTYKVIFSYWSLFPRLSFLGINYIVCELHSHHKWGTQMSPCVDRYFSEVVCLTFMAPVQLPPHGNVCMPGFRVKSDVTCNNCVR